MATATAQPGVVAALPFVASAHEHVEPAFTVTVTPTASVQQVNPIDIPAYGYLRYIFLEVSASGGVGGTGATDFPFNIFQQLTLQDVNGANLFGPVDGYAAYVANLVGGYSARPNPIDSPFYVGSAPNPVFYLRIPVEISRKNGLGALANQNSGANYKLSMAINTIAAMTPSTAFTTPPAIQIRGWLEAWTLPAAADNRGRPQAQVPPLLGTGQYWSTRTQSGVVVGNNTIPFTRLGNYIRNVVLIGRDASGARADTVIPDPISFNWDGMTIRNQSQRYAQQDFYEKTLGVITRPTGVFVLPFSHGGEIATMGDEDPDLWLPTTATSRLEITGSSAAAGTVQVLTNEVAPVEQDQTQRYVTPNQDARQTAAAVTA